MLEKEDAVLEAKVAVIESADRLYAVGYNAGLRAMADAVHVLLIPNHPLLGKEHPLNKLIEQAVSDLEK